MLQEILRKKKKKGPLKELKEILNYLTELYNAILKENVEKKKYCVFDNFLNFMRNIGYKLDGNVLKAESFTNDKFIIGITNIQYHTNKANIPNTFSITDFKPVISYAIRSIITNPHSKEFTPPPENADFSKSIDHYNKVEVAKYITWLIKKIVEPKAKEIEEKIKAIDKRIEVIEEKYELIREYLKFKEEVILFINNHTYGLSIFYLSMLPRVVDKYYEHFLTFKNYFEQRKSEAKNEKVIKSYEEILSFINKILNLLTYKDGEKINYYKLFSNFLVFVANVKIILGVSKMLDEFIDLEDEYVVYNEEKIRVKLGYSSEVSIKSELKDVEEFSKPLLAYHLILGFFRNTLKYYPQAFKDIILNLEIEREEEEIIGSGGLSEREVSELTGDYEENVEDIGFSVKREPVIRKKFTLTSKEEKYLTKLEEKLKNLLKSEFNYLTKSYKKSESNNNAVSRARKRAFTFIINYLNDIQDLNERKNYLNAIIKSALVNRLRIVNTLDQQLELEKAVGIKSDYVKVKNYTRAINNIDALLKTTKDEEKIKELTELKMRILKQKELNYE